MKHRLVLSTSAVLAVTLLSACGASAAGSSSPSATDAAPSVAPQVAPPAIANAGQLKVCTALSTGNPPTYFFDQTQTPTGAEVDFAKSVGQRLGLKVSFFDVAFASLIPSLQGGKCDVIMSSLYIKPERAEIVDFVPYMMSGSAVAVAKGNPKKITGMDDSMCGLKVVATVGKTAALQSAAQKDKCATDGKPAMQFTQVDSTTAGVQQVMTGQADAYAGETPVILYYQDKQPGTFQMAGKPFAPIQVGAAVKKGNSDLQKAVQKSFDEMNSDGEYTKILKKWTLQDLALKQS